MRIEVLYFDGCPHYQPVLDLVREVLREDQIAAEVKTVHVTTEAIARATHFLGSPTIQVDGVDVEPEARSLQDFGLMCRTYVTDGHREGLPSRELIRRALREAQGAGSNACCEPVAASRGVRVAVKGPSLLMVGSVLTAIGASLCCTLPIFFALTGFSILGASAFFESIRPYLLVVTAVLLGLGFYYAYRPIRQEACEPGSTCPGPNRRRTVRVVLWTVTVVAAAFMAFPYYSGSVAEFLLSRGQ